MWVDQSLYYRQKEREERVRREYYRHNEGEVRPITSKWSLGTGGRKYKCQTWMSVACREKGHQTRWRLGFAPICACHRLDGSCLPGAPAHKIHRRKMRGQGSRLDPCEVVPPGSAAKVIVPIVSTDGLKLTAAHGRTVRRRRRGA